LKVFGSQRRSLSLKALGYTDQVSVTVTGLSALNRHGPAARAHATFHSPAVKPRRHR
jgi:hypothetical protein